MLASILGREDNELMAVTQKIKVVDLDLTTHPEQIKYFDFSELVGKRPDIVDWDSTIQRIVNLHHRYYSLTMYQDPIPGWSDMSPFFIEAARWLVNNTAMGMIVGIGAPGPTESITQELFNQFRDSWMPNFESRFNEQPFQIAEQVYLRLSEALTNLGSIKTDRSLDKVLQKAEDNFNNLQKNYSNSLQETINVAKQSALDEITTAKSLADWVKYYGRVEAEYTVLIEGTGGVRLRWPLIRNNPGKTNSYSFKWPIKLTKNHMLEESGIKSFKLGEARKRLFWFVILGATVLIPVILAFNNQPEVFGFKNLFYIDASVKNIDYRLIALEKLRYLPALIFTSIGYAFSNKNFRILSNLREQYRHRKTVSTTLQGIITAIDENDKNVDIRTKLVEIGAKAMFDLKTIGHLTKKDSEASPMAEIIQTIRP